jgi:predicted transglutaminase-like protease
MEDWARKNEIINNIRLSLKDLRAEKDWHEEELEKVKIIIEKHEAVLENLTNDLEGEDIDDE